MTRPLYDDGAPAAQLAADGHRGLWFDKFCNTWGDGWGIDAQAKSRWLREVAAGQAGAAAEVADYAKRQLGLIDARGGEAAVVVAQSRFVSGLGLSHPVENGFAWHPTLGTPYLPGSSAKGLARAWAEYEGAAAADRDRVLGVPARAGTVAFLDAVPMQPVRLEVDVLTPHYANWIGTDLLGDWNSPVPVPFLVAARGLTLLCGVVPVGEGTGDDAATALDWLTKGLDDLGGGAKTAVGYGHFTEDDRNSTVDNWRAERVRRSARATPEGRWRQELQGKSEFQLYEAAATHLEKEPIADAAERRGFLAALLATGKVAQWRSGVQGPGMQAGAKKLKERAKLIDRCAAELGVDPLKAGQP